MATRTGTGSKSKADFTPSSGNVFLDIGFPKPEAEHLQIRAALLIRLEEEIKARGLKQKEAAKLLHVSQPRVSDLMRSRIELFSTDMLIEMLVRLDVSVSVVTTPARPRRRRVA